MRWHPAPSQVSACLLLVLQGVQISAQQHQLSYGTSNKTETDSGGLSTAQILTTTKTLVITETRSTPTTTRSIYSIIFPSPDASPVEVTAQSQVVTSYIPEMTWCAGPPLAHRPITGPPYLNSSTNLVPVVTGSHTCETSYTPTTTTICATTLTGLASKVTVTACDQQVTFSSECGFSLQTPSPTTVNSVLITPAPTVHRLFTYYLAPWQHLTAGDTPSDVDVKICTALTGADEGALDCIRYEEVWEVVLVTTTSTRTHSVQLAATLSGPGVLVVASIQQTITDTVEVVDLSTTLLLETEREVESTSFRRKTPVPTGSMGDVVSSTQTVYLTKTLHHQPSSSSPTPTYASPKLTSTIRITSTVKETRTSTVTRRRSSA